MGHAISLLQRHANGKSLLRRQTPTIQLPPSARHSHIVDPRDAGFYGYEES
jgi:hypothetical protein